MRYNFSSLITRSGSDFWQRNVHGPLFFLQADWAVFSFNLSKSLIYPPLIRTRAKKTARAADRVPRCSNSYASLIVLVKCSWSSSSHLKSILPQYHSGFRIRNWRQADPGISAMKWRMPLFWQIHRHNGCSWSMTLNWKTIDSQVLGLKFSRLKWEETPAVWADVGVSRNSVPFQISSMPRGLASLKFQIPWISNSIENSKNELGILRILKLIRGDLRREQSISSGLLGNAITFWCDSLCNRFWDICSVFLFLRRSHLATFAACGQIHQPHSSHGYHSWSRFWCHGFRAFRFPGRDWFGQSSNCEDISSDSLWHFQRLEFSFRILSGHTLNECKDIKFVLLDLETCNRFGCCKIQSQRQRGSRPKNHRLCKLWYRVHKEMYETWCLLFGSV